MGEWKSSGRMEPSTDVLQSSCSFSEQSKGVVDEATVMLPERSVVWKCNVFASSGQQVGGDLQGKTRMNVRTVLKQYFKIKWKKNIQTRTLLRAAETGNDIDLTPRTKTNTISVSVKGFLKMQWVFLLLCFSYQSSCEMVYRHEIYIGKSTLRNSYITEVLTKLGAS